MLTQPIPGQKYFEVGKFAAGTVLYDDAQILNRHPGRIEKIVVYAKKFIWAIQIFYSDSTSTGLHCGYAENETMPEIQELQLLPYENICLISGYAEEFIGALHIKTTNGRTLDIGKMPVGNLFSITSDSLILLKIVFGFTGYLNYIGALMGHESTYIHSAPPILFPPANSIQYPQLPISPVPMPNGYTNSYATQPISGYPPIQNPVPQISIQLPNIEYSAEFGTSSPDGKPFNDFETVVLPALKEGCKVRVCRLKTYKNDTGIIGIKPVYQITDKLGKTRKQEVQHWSKSVGFFTSRGAFNFKEDDYISYIQGKALMIIKQLKIINSKNKVVIEHGKNEGAEFMIIPNHHGPVLAFSGSVGEYLYTLRVYSSY